MVRLQDAQADDDGASSACAPISRPNIFLRHSSEPGPSATHSFSEKSKCGVMFRSSSSLRFGISVQQSSAGADRR